MRDAVRVLRGAPVAAGFSMVVIVATIAGRQAHAVLSAGAEPTLAGRQWWTPLTAILVAADYRALLLTVVLGVTLLAFAELRLGSRRTVIALLGGGVLSVALGVMVQAGVARWPGLEVLGDDSVLDPTIAVVAAVVAASGVASALWRRRLRLVIFAVVLVLALYAGDTASWFRLGAFVVGLVLGELWAGERKDRVWWRNSLQERRVLIASVVAIVGLGPLAALVSGGGRGPLALVTASFSEIDQRLTNRCAVHWTDVCDYQAVATITRGAGLALLAIVPLVLLVVAAVGLRIGRRSAWLLAVIVNVLLLVASIVTAITGEVAIPGKGIPFIAETVMWSISAVGLPAVLLVVLLVSRRAFRVRATGSASRRVAIVIVGALAVGLTVFLVGATLTTSSWSQPPTLLQLVDEALRRFIPPGLFPWHTIDPYPRRGPGLFLWQWVGVAFWVVVVVMLLWLYPRVHIDGAASEDRYRAVLRSGDAGTLGWLGTWSGVRHWFTPDGEAAVAYRIEEDVAIAVSDPACAAERRGEVVRGFASFAVAHGWTPVFYSAHDETVAALAEMGWQAMTVAEETVIRPQSWTMAGKAGEKVRHPVTRMQREGVTALWTSWAELPPALAGQIVEISEQWVAEKSLPEMGFTLGSVPEMQDPEVRLLLAIDAAGEVIGITSWLPSWRAGEPIGWTLDVMRRAPEAPNGVMEFLIASAAMRMKDDGVEVLSLSGAPLTLGPDEAARSPLIGSVLSRLADALEPLYGFGSLFRFKRKFRPEYRRLSLAYADPLDLPRVGLALTRAYLPAGAGEHVLALARRALERRR